MVITIKCNICLLFCLPLPNVVIVSLEQTQKKSGLCVSLSHGEVRRNQHACPGISWGLVNIHSGGFSSSLRQSHNGPTERNLTHTLTSTQIYTVLVKSLDTFSHVIYPIYIYIYMLKGQFTPKSFKLNILLPVVSFIHLNCFGKSCRVLETSAIEMSAFSQR